MVAGRALDVGCDGVSGLHSLVLYIGFQSHSFGDLAAVVGGLGADMAWYVRKNKPT